MPVEIPSLPSSKSVKRDTWAHKREFLLSCMGYSIGIGNVWRFPYLCYQNGGGAFLVPYVLVMLLCGVPLFFLETSLGQFSSSGCISVYRISPLFKGTGYAILVINTISMSYYSVVISYALLFIWHTFNAQIPWQGCNHLWNTEHCTELKSGSSQIDEGHYLNYTVTNHTTLLLLKRTPADEFFYYQFLHISEHIGEIGNIVWPIAYVTVLTWLITYFCISKGVKSLGKVVYFTATFPFVILAVLLVRGLTLPGSWSGVKFFINPKWTHLFNFRVWTDAAIQTLFSLGPGWGVLINMASHNEFHYNSVRYAILISVLNFATSMMAGFAVFSVLGYMSHERGMAISKAATGGPGLAFVTYPEALMLLPWPRLWSVLFFLMFFLLGLDTFFVQMDTIISTMHELFPLPKRFKSLATLLICVLSMCLSLFYATNGGLYYIQLMDSYTTIIAVVLICLVEVLIVGWIYGVKKFKRDVEFMVNVPLSSLWSISWKYITPVLLCCLLVSTFHSKGVTSYRGQTYPSWLLTMAWCFSFSSVACVPLYMVYLLCLHRCSKRFHIASGTTIVQIFTSLLNPSEDWAPAKADIKIRWHQHIAVNELNGFDAVNGDKLISSGMETK